MVSSVSLSKESKEDNGNHEVDGEVPVKTAIKNAIDSLRIYKDPLSPADKVMVMQGWNKVLAFKTAFSEALWIYWRILVASKTGSSGAADNAVRCVELNKDPLVLCMMDRSSEAEDMLMGLLDGAFRSMCPAHQTVQREAYRAIQDDVHLKRSRGDAISLECETPEDYLKLFARCGVLPDHWVHFCEAFVWAVQTHTPYAQDDDKSDLERGGDSACIRAVAQLVALPAIKAYMNLKSLGENPLYQVAAPLFWSKLTPDDRFSFGEGFYRTLLTKHPNLLDYFSKTDMDSLVIHFVASIDLIVNSASELASADGYLRRVLDRLGKVHRTIGVPTYAYALVGGNLIECLQPLFEKEEQETKSTSHPVTAKQLRLAFLTLYSEIMSMVYYPMLRHEKQVEEAREFYVQLQAELQWTDAQLSRRMEQVDQEIGATGTYTQTSEELEVGARLAWRNSAKCIGRISWNTLQVRDCRHINNPEEIFQEVQEHLKIATAGTNIQSVMTVFKPKGPSEPFGTRFWSSQYVRYAGYTKDENGGILGDPANLGITEYLLKNGYWSSPVPQTAFDVLPLLLKVPGRERPYVYQLPKEFVFEVNIEHPTMPEMKTLGYRWATVPAISNFKMNLGGVLYQNMPFNGWFMSTEIVRNLMERYDAGPAIAKVMGLDMANHPAWRQAVASEVSVLWLLVFYSAVLIAAN
jgi:nitric oxide synthase oxygenase domain/subunit/hemoglobin-like flavoprotein